MSINTFYREQLVERMYDDGTYEEKKAEAFDFIMDNKDRKDWINDALLTKLAEDYDLTHAVRKFTDEQKLEVFSTLLEFAGELLDDETDNLAHSEIVCMAEDGE
jgi:hypothetical protein